MAEILEQLMSPRMLSSSTAAPDEPTLFPHPATPPKHMPVMLPVLRGERRDLCKQCVSWGGGR